jgi:hypothetical protein
MTAMRAIVLVAALLPATAVAQSSAADIAYCNRLADIYVHYLGRSEAGPYDDQRRGSLDTQVAATQCRQGITVSAIPILERELRNNGFTLPPRG